MANAHLPRKRRSLYPAALLAALLLSGAPNLSAQSSTPNAGNATPGSKPEDGEAHCRKLLAVMVEALGGQKWLSLRSTYLEGRTSSFYQGKPTGSVSDFFSTRTPPTPQVQGDERIEYTKKRDIAAIFNPNAAWEITYRGKRPLPDEQAQDYFRRRDHSIDTAILVWLKDPATVLLSEGQTVAERHLTDQITLISSANDSITIQLDTDTHLPLRRTFRWRDPLYKDKNEEVDEYDDYHTIDGIATPFTLTRFHNGDMNNQRFLYKAAYNVAIAPDTFNADALAAKLKH